MFKVSENTPAPDLFPQYICVASYFITHRDIFRLVHPELPGWELHYEPAIKYIRVSNRISVQAAKIGDSGMSSSCANQSARTFQPVHYLSRLLLNKDIERWKHQ
jgi:hypothetical protein